MLVIALSAIYRRLPRPAFWLVFVALLFVSLYERFIDQPSIAFSKLAAELARIARSSASDSTSSKSESLIADPQASRVGCSA